MQENIAFRKTLKKVAALGTSLAMVGVTISGALAVNLGDYSSFTKSGTAVVFGEAGTDSVAVSDVVAGLPGSASAGSAGEPVAGALELSDFEDGESQDFEPGTNLSQAAAFGKSCFNENDDLGLLDWEQNINIDSDKDYDVHEEFCFGSGPGDVPDLTTSLAELDDDLGTEPIIYIPEGGLNYTIVFEEALDTNNRFTNATSAKQITLESFLGSKLRVSSATASPAQITALVGESEQLHTGDTFTSGDCTVEVLAIDANEVYVNVNGEPPQTINEDSNARFGDCEVHIDSAIETTDGEGIAVIYVGEQASETFKSGDRAPGEDKNHFLWEWTLGALQSTKPVLAMTLAEDFTSDKTNFEDEIMDLGLMRTNRKHLREGDYLCLPNYHECLILEGPKKETTRCEIEVNADQQTETLPGLPNNFIGYSSKYTNANVVVFEASGCGTDQGFKVDDNGDGTFNIDTDKVALYWDSDLLTSADQLSRGSAANTPGELLIYYENTDSNWTITNASATKTGVGPMTANSSRGETANRNISAEDTLFEIDYDDFDNAAVSAWDFYNLTGGAGTTSSAGVVAFNADNDTTLAILSIELDDEGSVTAGSKPRLWFELGLGAGVISLGRQTGEDTTKYLKYSPNATLNNDSISSLDEDVLALSGIIVESPEDNYNDDRIILQVPNDDEYEYVVRVARPKEGTVSTTGTVTSGSVSMSDSEVTDVASLNKDVVVVGGPAVNKVAADLLGVDFPTYGSQLAGLEAGTAVLEMKALTNGKSALLVYGWEQDDTRRAAVLLRDPAVLTQKLSDAGLSDADSATVTGTDFSVAGITVSA